MGALLFLLHAAVTTLKMAGGAIVSALRRLNVYGAIVARLLFDAVEFERFWCSTKQSYQKLCTKSLSVLVPFAPTYLYKSGFSSLLHLKNKYRDHLNPSKDLRMALSNCVPRFVRIISEKQQKVIIGLFLTSSKV